jgi:3-oxoacyl-[acyl-carrier-protein] synthase-1
MRRVVVTGLGIVSSIGNNADEVSASLKAGRSGITANAAMAEHGFRSQIAGAVDLDRRSISTSAPCASWGRARPIPTSPWGRPSPMRAFRGRGRQPDDRPHRGLRRAVDLGHAGRAPDGAVDRRDQADRPLRGAEMHVLHGQREPRDGLPDQGDEFLHHLGLLDLAALHRHGGAADHALGKQDIMFAGGGEELDWTLSCLFDAMGAMSSKFNDTPERASRAFDADRDGFVISGGGAMVVLEPLDRAVARGAKIYAEVTGFAATSDGPTWWPPRARAASGPCAARCAPCPRTGGQLHQRPRHLHAGGRRGRDRGGAPRLR